MTFEKALSLAKTGKLITSDLWEQDEFLCLTVYKNEKMLIRINNKEIVRYIPTQREMLSNGWKIAVNADTNLIKEDRFKLYTYKVACTFIEDNKVKYSILTISVIKKIETDRELEELKVIIAQIIPSMVYNLEILAISLVK